MIRKTLLAALAIVALAVPAAAGPGAVNKQGCHSKPKHCHVASEIRTGKSGFRYVAWQGR
jgi:hypothetical protein